MRILVVNPNTSDAVTDVIAAAAMRFRSSGTDLTFVTGGFGARVVATRSENAVATHATVDLVARHADGVDGIVLGISFDSGLAAARELSGLPVIGLTEASLLAGSTMGSRLGLVVLAGRAGPLYRDLVEAYGMGKLVCGIRALDNEAFYDGGDASEGNADLIDAARRLVTDNGAEVVVLAGAVLGGRSLAIESEVPVPVIDGVRCAIPMIEAMVRIGARKPLLGSFAPPSGRKSVALSPDLERRLLGSGGSDLPSRG